MYGKGEAHKSDVVIMERAWTPRISQ